MLPHMGQLAAGEFIINALTPLFVVRDFILLLRPQKQYHMCLQEYLCCNGIFLKPSLQGLVENSIHDFCRE